jgi:DNA polymerase-3 subunit epsilon
MTNWGRLGVFDLETTGIDVDTSRIVSACIAVLDEQGEVVKRWDWLADPGIDIPEGASAVHGITTERARAEGRPAVQVVGEIAQTLRVLFALGMPVVVYNAPYDLTLLDRECRRHQLRPIRNTTPVIDPLVLDKALDRYRKGKRTLEITADLYGVSLADAHDAGADAIAAGRVAQALQRAYPDELGIPSVELHARQEVWYAEQAASFQDYIRQAKGDADYVADTAWPMRPSEYPDSFLDTQPIPAPEPRPSLTVPVFDLYGTGALSLEALSSAPAEAFATRTSAYASAPPPVAPRKTTVLRVAAGIVTDAAGRTLLVRKRGSASFMQAGGKIEPGESALDALSRELREEIGLELDLDTTEYLGSFRAVAANEVDTVIRAEVFALVMTSSPEASGEIEELLWLDDPAAAGIELAPLTRETILPIWIERRSALF